MMSFEVDSIPCVNPTVIQGWRMLFLCLVSEDVKGRGRRTREIANCLGKWGPQALSTQLCLSGLKETDHDRLFGRFQNSCCCSVAKASQNLSCSSQWLVIHVLWGQVGLASCRWRLPRPREASCTALSLYHLTNLRNTELYFPG